MDTKERPILFSAPMVRAILDGRKTQTRRVVTHEWAHGLRNRAKFAPCSGRDDFVTFSEPYSRWAEKPIWFYSWGNVRWLSCPHGSPKDRLWVRETWAVQHEYDAAAPSEIDASARWHYAATEDLGGLRKRPSIFLPRLGSRILVEIIDVRVQRLQDISEDDARAEGIERVGGEHSCSPWRNYLLQPMAPAALNSSSPCHSFMTLWESINGTGSWDASPWVWAITFRRLQP